MADAGDWAPDSCTLPSAERPLRVTEFGDLFSHVVRSTRAETTRLDLVLPAELESAARDLARRESECCAFFSFQFEPADDVVMMRIEVPAVQIEVLDAIERAQNQ